LILVIYSHNDLYMFYYLGPYWLGRSWCNTS